MKQIQVTISIVIIIIFGCNSKRFFYYQDDIPKNKEFSAFLFSKLKSDNEINNNNNNTFYVSYFYPLPHGGADIYSPSIPVDFKIIIDNQVGCKFLNDLKIDSSYSWCFYNCFEDNNLSLKFPDSMLNIKFQIIDLKKNRKKNRDLYY